MHSLNAPQTVSLSEESPKQICVATLQSEPPNYLRVKQVPVLGPELEKNHDGRTRSSIEELKSYKNKSQESTKDLNNDKESYHDKTYNNWRGEDKYPKKKWGLDEKYKRFSMNNLDEFKNSMINLFDFSTPKEGLQSRMSKFSYYVNEHNFLCINVNRNSASSFKSYFFCLICLIK